MPGEQIQITTEFEGLHAVPASKRRVNAEGARENGRPFHFIWDAPVSLGPEERTNVVVFDKPGYYAISAGLWVTGSEASRPITVGDSELLKSAHERVFVLIDSSGGRIDALYDTMVVHRAVQKGQRLAHGALGELLPMPSGNQSDGGSQNSLRARLMVDPVMSLNLTYLQQDSAPNLRVPVELGNFNGACKNGGTTTLTVQRYTDGLGDMNIICPAGSTSLQGNLTLHSSIAQLHHSFTNPFGGFIDVPVSIPVNIAANDYDSLYLAYDEPGKIYRQHHQFGYPAALTEFGRSRSLIRYGFHPGVATSSFYDYADIIRMRNPTSVWGQRGDFIILHEWGHAYHYSAIDPWVTSAFTCGPNGHTFGQQNTNSCSYVEGFADFFAAWLLRNHSSLAYATANGVADDSWHRFVGNGLLIEGTMSAMFWDLADTGPSDDDSVYIGPLAIADVMRQCILNSPYNNRLTHADQIIFCLEGVANSAKFQAPLAYQSSGWGSYGAALTWDFGTPPTLPNFAGYRASWKHNLYGI